MCVCDCVCGHMTWEVQSSGIDRYVSHIPDVCTRHA